MAESEEEQERVLMQMKEESEVKEESEKVGLKLNIQKTKITASGPITSWQIAGARNPPRLLIMPGLLRPTREGV